MNGLSSAEATILQTLIEQTRQMAELEKQLGEIRQRLLNLDGLTDIQDDLAYLRESVETLSGQKDWYSTAEIASLMGVTRHTVQVRWCAEGRIECEKDPATNRWRIPGHEYDRPRRGGKPEAA